MDYEKAVGSFEGDDLKIPAALVGTDPTKCGLTGLVVASDVGGGHGDHVISGLASDPVLSGSPREPDRLHLLIVSDTKDYCKTQSKVC